MLKTEPPIPPEKKNWNALLQAAREGCDDSLGEILTKVRCYLTLCADRNLGSNLRAKFGASDVVQTSMLEAQQSFDSFNGTTEAEMKAWLKRIVLNNLTDESRRYTQTKSRNIDQEQRITGSSDWRLADHVTSSAIIGKREQDEQLVDAMAKLPMPLQQVVEARHRFGYTFAQIAIHMQVTERTARKRYSEALDKLNHALAADDV